MLEAKKQTVQLQKMSAFWKGVILMWHFFFRPTPKSSVIRRRFGLILVLGCLLILGSCNSEGPKQVERPDQVTKSMKAQGQILLQTYQQWITHMQQYHGLTPQYTQQYATYQHAL